LQLNTEAPFHSIISKLGLLRWNQQKRKYLYLILRYAKSRQRRCFSLKVKNGDLDAGFFFCFFLGGDINLNKHVEYPDNQIEAT
jgi:hypothetical protein